MRRPAIALGAAAAALGGASTALACSPVPPAPGDVRDVHVVAGPAGRAVVTWERQGGPREEVEPRAVALDVRGRWAWADPVDAPASPPPATYPGHAGAVVGAAPAGHAVAVWRVIEPVFETPGTLRRTIRTAHRGPDGTWSPESAIWSSEAPVRIPPNLCSSDAYGGPVAAVDDAGNAVAAWVDRDPDPAGKVLKWAARPAGGAWSAPVVIGPAGEDLGLTVDASGAAVLTWVGGGELLAAVRPAGGVFGAAERLGSARSAWPDGAGPSVTVDPSGRALAVWAASKRRVVAADRGPGGAWSAPVDLSRIAEDPPPLISAVGLTRTRLRTGATALTFRMRAAGEVVVTVRRKGRGPAVRGVRVRAARGLNRIVLLRRPVRPGAYTVRMTARARDWAPASRAKRVVVLPRR